MNYIKLILLSMVPVIELREAIPVVLIFKQVIDFFRHRKYFNTVIRYIDVKHPLEIFSRGYFTTKKGRKIALYKVL